MQSLVEKLFSSRKKKEILVLLKRKDWCYIGAGKSYTTISLDEPGLRYIISASLTNVHVTLLNVITGRFIFDYKFAPQSLLFSQIDFSIFFKAHKKVKKLAKAHLLEQEMVSAIPVHV